MLFKQSILVVFLFILNLVVSAQDNKRYKLFEQENYQFPYELTKPNKSWILPDNLSEISGLTYFYENRLACVQDEKGNIYFFDTIKGKVTEKIKFADDGDYEGITMVNDQLWVLKSNGNLFRVKYSNKKETIVTKEYKTALSKKNDTEGLVFDAENSRLLIACKGYSHIDEKKGKSKKAVYSFDLDEKKLSSKAVFKIDLDQIKELKELNKVAKLGIDLLTYIYPSKGDVSFQPSGIAIHPSTKNIYLLASVGKLLVVCNNNGELIAVYKLKTGLFWQPEGICFDPMGNLYIANEGEESVATLLKFQPKKQSN